MRIVIEGEPLPKERPRMNRKSGTVYTPRHTRDYENMIAMIVRSKKISFGKSPIRFTAYFYTSKKSPADCDNLFKSLSDGAAIGGAFDNDRQICEVIIKRIQSPHPRVEFEIEAIEAPGPFEDDPRCKYCGKLAVKGTKSLKWITCAEHADLPALDPDYEKWLNEAP